MTKFFTVLPVLVVIALLAPCAGAAELSRPTPPPRHELELIELTAQRDALRGEIAQIDSEQIRCKKQKTGWAVATGVGSAGVLGTGIAAIVQGSKQKKAKNELSDRSQNLQQINQQISTYK